MNSNWLALVVYDACDCVIVCVCVCQNAARRKKNICDKKKIYIFSPISCSIACCVYVFLLLRFLRICCFFFFISVGLVCLLASFLFEFFFLLLLLLQKRKKEISLSVFKWEIDCKIALILDLLFFFKLLRFFYLFILSMHLIRIGQLDWKNWLAFYTHCTLWIYEKKKKIHPDLLNEQKKKYVLYR